mmetsp:Transcript_26696/g.58242  ORF Transcript_26696/g.58242 Transcript_26696/m.58242 type:complete len:215 (+) Transcript_26696:3-647(+)
MVEASAPPGALATCSRAVVPPPPCAELGRKTLADLGRAVGNKAVSKGVPPPLLPRLSPLGAGKAASEVGAEVTARLRRPIKSAESGRRAGIAPPLPWLLAELGREAKVEEARPGDAPLRGVVPPTPVDLCEAGVVQDAVAGAGGGDKALTGLLPPAAWAPIVDRRRSAAAFPVALASTPRSSQATISCWPPSAVVAAGARTSCQEAGGQGATTC